MKEMINEPGNQEGTQPYGRKHEDFTGRTDEKN